MAYGLQVHSEVLVRRYYSSLFSFASLYNLISGVFLIFLPLFIAYNSSGFWLTEKTVLTQPSIQYDFNTIIEMTGLRVDGSPLQLFYSTSDTLNTLHANNLRVPSLRSREIDENDDGNTDMLAFTVTMPLDIGDQISDVNVVIGTKVALSSSIIHYSWYDYSVIQQSCPYPVSSISIDGDLVLQQNVLFTPSYKSRHDFDRIVLEQNELLTLTDFIESSRARNVSLSFRSRAVSYSHSKSDSDSVDVNIIVRVPPQYIRYVPESWDAIKYAWPQYLAFFVVVWFIVQRFNDLVFREKLVYSSSISDVIVESKER